MKQKPKMQQLERDLSFLPGRRLVRVVTLVLIIGVFTGILISFGPSVYRHFKVQRLVHDAEGFQREGDRVRAVLAAQSALKVQPDNLQALQVLAAIADESGSPLSMQLRQRLVTANPGDDSLLLALARAQIDAGQVTEALSSLEQVSSEARGEVKYWNILSKARRSQGQAAAAITAAEEAYRLAGSHSSEALNLALALVSHSSEQTAARLNEVIAEVWDDDELRLKMSRLLLELSLRDDDHETALVLANRISSEKLSSVQDQVVYYQLLSRIDFERALVLAEESLLAAEQPASELLPIVKWLLLRGAGETVLDWLKTLPEKEREQTAIAVVEADALAVCGRWQKLSETVSAERWRGPEFVRLAYLARVLHEQDTKVAADARWGQAVREAALAPQFLWLLWQVSSRWPGWKLRKLDVLWELYETSKAPQVLLLLAENYQQKGDADNLLRVAKKLYALNTDNHTAANNFAYLSLLLDEDREAAFELAAKLYHAAPDNIARISTYLFALQVTGRLEEAARLLDGLPVELAKAPEIALTKAMLYDSIGDSRTAKLLLEQVDRESLLDAEMLLLTNIANSASR